MVGLLDYVNGFTTDPAFSNMPNPAMWGALNQPSPVAGDAEEAKRRAAEAVLAGSMGIDPASIPQRSPFDVPQQPLPAPAPAAAPAFGAGATPFGFAGPGSMSNVNPAQFAAAPPPAPSFGAGATPVPFAAGPVTPQPAPVPSSTDVSARGRSPDATIPVGNYQMPAFRGATAAPAADDEEATPAPAAPVSAPGSPAPFSFAGAGNALSDRFGKATRGFLGNLGNGPIGALAGGVGALVTGQNTDPGSIAAEGATATARALRSKGASAEEVAAARGNPELMKALVAQYYGKEKYTVVQDGERDGVKQYSVFNTQTGERKPIQGSSSGGAPDVVTGPDGKPIVIPPGVDRKEFIKRVSEASADAATGKSTEAQAKAGAFATRMGQAEKLLATVQNEGLSLGNKVAGAIPMAGNYLQSPEYQRYKQASSAFITAMLRQESGAAINKSEFDRYEKELFPQPGDDPSVVAQKAQMRAAATEQMRRSAGPGFKGQAAASGPVASGKTASGISWSVN